MESDSLLKTYITYRKELDVFKITSKSNNNTIGFFGELNPLSNFHPCKFEINGIQFHSSEQFIQYTKAMFFNDLEMSTKILASKSALESKNMSRSIKGYEDSKWDECAKLLCQKGISEKFRQNPRLMEALANTGSKVLVESVGNKLWGTGVPLHKAGCLDSTLWSGNGILGEILCEIHQEYFQQNPNVTGSLSGVTETTAVVATEEEMS